MRVRTNYGVGTVIGRVPNADLLCIRLDSGGYVECEVIAAVRLLVPSGPPLRVPSGTTARNLLSGVTGTVGGYSARGDLVCVKLGQVPTWFDAREWVGVDASSEGG